MQFLLPWMAPDLEVWRGREIHPLAARDRVPRPYHDRLELTLATEEAGPPEGSGPFRRVSRSVLRYDVFGSKIGTPVGAGSEVEVGQTIGLRYRFLPGLSLFFASRVVAVFKERETEEGWSSGFVYQTLYGHPELGEEVFEVTKHRSGAVTFRMEAWSRPNLWYVKLFTPWARAVQKRAARRAAEHLSAIAQGRRVER